MTLKNFLIGFLMVVLLLVGYAIHAGIAVVRVKSPEANLWIPVPIAIGHWVGEFIDLPLNQEPAFEKFLEYREAATEILRQLKDLPDSNLVEVKKSNEHVRIFKRGDSLCVEVNDPGENVKVRIPLRTAERLLDAMSRHHVKVGDLVACLEWQPSGDIVHVKTDSEEVRVSIW